MIDMVEIVQDIYFHLSKPCALLMLAFTLDLCRKHPSPNSGMPEAAMAGALGVRLGGPSSYWGQL